MTTVAPGIAEPEASVMVPLIDPPTTCACNGAALITSAATIPAMADDAMERIALISRSRDETTLVKRSVWNRLTHATLPVHPATTTTCATINSAAVTGTARGYRRLRRNSQRRCGQQMHAVSWSLRYLQL